MISIRDGNNTYLFFWRGEPVPPPEMKAGPGDARAFEMSFGSPAQARFLLQTFEHTWEFHRLCGSDPMADPTRWSGDQVLDHLAQQLVSGRLRVERRWVQMPSGGSVVVDKVVVPRRSVSSSSSAPVLDPPTFPQDHDGNSQAAVLAGAAETGVPFCAECMRAEMQAAAAAAAAAAKVSPQQLNSAVPPAPDKSTFPANSDTAAQAQTLLDASSAGVPFCEECERAAQQQAAA